MPTERQPLVTVLTPVFNGEKFLAECIESVLAQTYQNWEYVIVNNCSTDKTLEIAARYVKNHRRIRIHNNSEHLPIIRIGTMQFVRFLLKANIAKKYMLTTFYFRAVLRKWLRLPKAIRQLVLSGRIRCEGTKWNAMA